jgi:hypothetical protein
LRWAAALAAVVALATPVCANDVPDVDRGLSWLAEKQAKDGSFGQNNKLAITGMAGLALLASGSTPKRGPYAEHLRRAILFILSCQGEGKAFVHSSSGYSAIHNHGYALLFLTQAYGEAGFLDERLRSAIRRGIRATEESQRENGGFSYYLWDKQPLEHKEMWRADEASTTISQIQALRGARNAGFDVDARKLKKAADYVARSQHRATGGFVYSIGDYRVSLVEGDPNPTFTITAAATAALHALGDYEGPLVERGIAYLLKFRPDTYKGKVPFFYYGHYYAAQVMHLRGGPDGRQWLDVVMKELATLQEADGGWVADEDSLSTLDSRTLNTAWALQVALIERGVLPLHER